MSLANYFPRTAAAFPHLIDWAAPFGWQDPATGSTIETLSACMIAEQRHGWPHFLGLATLLRKDLTDEAARTRGGPEAGNIAATCFIFAVPAAFATLSEGQHGECYGWVHWGICPEHVFEARRNTNDYVLPPYAGASDHLNALARLYLVDWVRNAYFIARKFGGLDGLATVFFDAAFGEVMDAIGREDPSGVEALIAMLNWATKHGHPRARVLTALALDLFETNLMPPRSQVILGVAFVTAAAQWTTLSPQQWAHKLLDNYRADLVGHELVQILAVALSTYEEWIAGREECLIEIRNLAESFRQSSVDDVAANLSLEARVDILQPLIYNLTNFGDVNDLIDVLWAWYGSDGAERGDANVLFVAAAHAEGVTYMWRGGRWTRPGPVVGKTLQGMMDGISVALTDYFRGPNGDRDIELDERMIGAPAFEQASILREAMDAHYDFAGLLAQLPSDFRPRSIIVVPALRDPFQAMLLDRTGWLAPMDASLADTHDIRTIKTISIWPGSTQLTEAEVECVSTVGAATGWAVKVVDGPLDEAAFQRFYEDPEPDVLWVISHGEQSPYNIAETGVILKDDALLPITRIAKMKIPDQGRRLLVLNICSSGAAHHRGGIARIGLGHFLASPAQAVTAHLWPIDYYAALAFGCALSLALSREALPNAFGTAIALMRNRDGLLAALASFGGHLQAADRLSSDRMQDHLANLLNWGCPILVT